MKAAIWILAGGFCVALLVLIVVLGFWLFPTPPKTAWSNVNVPAKATPIPVTTPAAQTPVPASTPVAPTSNTANERTVEINQSKTFNGLEIVINRIEMTSLDVTVGMTIINRTKHTLAFYPDQKSIVIEKNQLDAKFLQAKELSGDINPGVEKSGNVIFESKSGDLQINNINKIDLRLGEIFNLNNYNSVECNWTLNIPK